MNRQETPRDLLFGLLALHTGLIDQEQLLAAFGAWIRARGMALAELLVERGAIDEESRALLAGMAEKQLKLHDGDAEKSLAAIAAGPSTRDRLAALGDADLTASVAIVGSHTPSPDATATMSVGTSTSDGQRFRVLRPHAQGGLGTVFVALDGELNREVALKRILDHHADDPIRRTRFLIEAEITGGLEHPGIVPVYGLGHHADGRPYYAMRFIRGDSLKDAIAAYHADASLKDDPGKRSLALRKLLRRFVDVCNAIGYAHGRGVLHRDIKPGNVIVGKYGETLVVDWGLAKAMGAADPSAVGDERTLMPSSASVSAVTLPGSAIGTPAYMSPEQAAGDLEKLGPRSDVYSLGATLYCLLTGHAPFEGTDVGAVLRDVQKGAFPPPRQVAPSIDKALEAVCLKAMATDPDARHATARSLADDVERWSADEPTSAYAEPASVRARRWMRRNRTAVAAASVALVAGVVGLTAVLAVQTRAKNDLAKANGDLAAANARLNDSLRREEKANGELTRSRAAVEARYELAVEAIKTFHTGVSQDFLLKEAQFKELRDRLLRSASDFYGKLGALLGKETDLAARRALARSNFELADLTDQVGRKEDALAAHRAVLASRQGLAAEPGAGSDETVDVGRSLAAIAGPLKATGHAKEALESYRRSESLLIGPATADPAARAALASCRSEMGWLLAATGKRDEAVAAYRLAWADQEALASAPGASNQARCDLEDTIIRLAVVLHDLGRQTEATREYHASMAIYQELADDHPAVTLFRSRLADSHFDLGILLMDTGRQVEAAEQFASTLAIRRKLADDHPAVTDFRNLLAASHHGLGIVLGSAGSPAEGLAELEEAGAIYRALAEANPTVPDFRNALASILSDGGDCLRALGRSDEARDGYARAIAIGEELVKANPTVPFYRFCLANSVWRLGLARIQAGELGGAAHDARRALGLFGGLPSRSGLEWFETACAHAALAGLAGREGSGVPAEEAEPEAGRAMELLRKAVGMGYRNSQARNSDAGLDPLRDRPDFRLLMLDLAFPAEPFAR